MKDNKILEGLESIDRIKLLMGYSLGKTLNENKEDLNLIILEQLNSTASDIAVKLIDALSGWVDDDEDEALSQIKRINSKELLNRVNDLIKTNKKMALKDYLNSEMSDVDWQYKSIFDHLKNLDSSYGGGYKENKTYQTIGKGIDYVTGGDKKQGNNKTELSVQKKEPNIISPNGLETKGPYMSDGPSGSTVSSELPTVNVPYKNNTIIVGDKNDSTFFYTIKNNTKKTISITDIKTSSPDTLLVSPSSNNILPGKSIKLFGETKVKPIEFTKPDKIQMARDNTYVAPKTLPIEKFVKTTKESVNDIVIKTNIGDIKIDILTDISEASKTQKEYIRLYNERKSIPIQLPNGNWSSGGYSVPEYFSPFDYDEFLYELKSLVKSCPSISYLYEKYSNHLNEQSVIGAPNYGTISKPTEDEKTRWACQDKANEIIGKYKNDKFPHGITREDLEDFNQKYNKEISALKSFENNHKKMRNREPYDYYFSEGSLTAKEKEEYNKLKSNVERISQYYGFDSRNGFEKWFDEWSAVAQIGAAVALFIGGFFTEGATWTMLGEVWTWSRFAMVVDLTLNVGIGLEHLRRGNTKEALVSFVFAGLTQLHKIYDIVKIKTNNLGITNYKELGNSIAKKISQPGVSLSTAQEVNAFMAQLTRQERAVFRTVARIDETTLKNSIGDLANEVRKVKTGYGKIPFTSAEKLIKQGGKNFVVKATVDMGVTLPLVRLTYDKIKSIFKSNGIDITWGERDKKLLEELAEKLTESEIKRMGINIEKVYNSLKEQEQKYFAEQMQNVYKATDFINIAKMKEVQPLIQKIKDDLQKSLKDTESTVSKIDLSGKSSEFDSLKKKYLDLYKNKNVSDTTNVNK